MAVDIDSYKRDLDQLKNQRSVIQAKLDEANRHVNELTETLKGMGFNTVDEAKQAYARQLGEAETQHELVKQLIQEINNVDANIPSREDVMAKLNALSQGNFNVSQVQAQPVVPQPVVTETPVINAPVTPIEPVADVSPQAVANAQTTPVNDFIQQNVIPPTTPAPASPANEGSVNLSDMLFASL